MAGDQEKIRLPWKRVYWIVLLVFIGFLIYWGYNFAFLQVYRGQERQLLADIGARDAEIQKAFESSDYPTYIAAKKLLLANKDGGWLTRLSRVIEIFTTLQNLGGGNVQFSDFKIDFDLISLKGTVPNLSYIYAKN